MISSKKIFQRTVFITVFLIGFMHVPEYMAADADLKFRECFKKNFPEYAELIPSIICIQNFINTYDAEINGFKFTISSGFSNHSAGGNEEAMSTKRAALNIDAGCTSGFYPNKLDFAAGIHFLLKEDQLSEDVTSLHLSYDYHLVHWLESFAFIDRSSNSYMGIQQRYEIGGGLKLEFESGFVPKTRKNEYDKFKGHKMILDKGNEKGIDILEKLKEKEKKNFENICFFYKLISEISGLAGEIGLFETIIRNYEGNVSADPPSGNNESGVPVTNNYLVFIKENKRKFELHILPKIRNSQTLKAPILEFLEKEKEKTEKKDKEMNLFFLEFTSLKQKAEMIKRAFKKRYALVGFGILFSYLKEIEHAEIEFDPDPLGCEDTLEVRTIKPWQDYRFAIRPNIFLRLHESLYLRSDVYWKFPFNFKGMDDYRINMINRLEFLLPSTYRWAKKVYLSLEYQFYYDNAPPSLKIGEDEISAKNKYSELLFRINITF